MAAIRKANFGSEENSSLHDKWEPAGRSRHQAAFRCDQVNGGFTANWSHWPVSRVPVNILGGE